METAAVVTHVHKFSHIPSRSSLTSRRDGVFMKKNMTPPSPVYPGST
jgi:hypothetical protein